jgi:hypothetical protein
MGGYGLASWMHLPHVRAEIERLGAVPRADDSIAVS